MLCNTTACKINPQYESQWTYYDGVVITATIDGDLGGTKDKQVWFMQFVDAHVSGR